MDTVRLISNTAENGGGGAYLQSGTTTVLDGQILSNTAPTGAGLYVAYGEATVSGGEIRGNIADSHGGGIYIDEAVFTQTGATEIAHNVADEGGGLYVRHGATATLTGAGIYSNTASVTGGGLLVSDASASVIGGYVTNNTADVGGGALNYGTLTLVNTTVSGNHADRDAGGIWNEGTLVLTYTTVAHNTAAGGSGGIGNQQDAFAQNTIVAGNKPFNCVDDGLVSMGYNLEDADTCGLAGTGDQTDTEPKLLPLAEDRGTMVHALQKDSPAIDAGICVNDIPTDQRGVDRPQGAAGKCDTGAYEFNLIGVYLPLVLRNP